MRALIVYGTTEGHTRELAEVVAERLKRAHVGASTHEAGEAADLPVGDYDAVIVAASLHLGRYQSSVLRFARRHHEVLNRLSSAFISVSLSAAGFDAEDWAGLDSCIHALEHRTGWTPTMIHHAAGGIPFTSFDLFRRYVLKSIAAKRGLDLDTSQDYDFTDYEVLGGFVDGFMASAAANARPREAA
jgi:menaquinone-dependent protoporphyrinogen oxidase